MEDIQSGLHLFHFDFSNCSQRVRICLIEKGLRWNSHPVNLLLNEHASDWFQAINPKGLVPVLVHDGKVVTESMEIVRYIDRVYPEPRLQPPSSSDVTLVNDIVSLADDVQSHIKLLTHYFLARPQRFLVKRSLKKFSNNHQNSDLVNFKTRFANDDFTVSEVRDSIDAMHRMMRTLDAYLIKQKWFVGGDFTLADIAWMVNVHRLDLMGFPLSHYRNLQEWYIRCKDRPSFRLGLVNYEPTLIMSIFKVTTLLNRKKHRRLFGF